MNRLTQKITLPLWEVLLPWVYVTVLTVVMILEAGR
jgi:hypothetical protein